GVLRRPSASRCQGGRIAGAVPHQVQAGGQPKDRQGDWSHNPRDVPGARRRGDRVNGPVRPLVAERMEDGKSATRTSTSDKRPISGPQPPLRQSLATDSLVRSQLFEAGGTCTAASKHCIRLKWVKTGKAQTEQMFPGLPPIADI